MATVRPKLVSCFETLTSLLEQAKRVEGTGYISPQQPFGDVAGCLWQFRRGNYSKLYHVALLMAPSGPISKLATLNGWPEQFQRLRSAFEECFQALNRIRYAGSEQGVELGDHVGIRSLLRKRAGRVSYLPGASEPRSVIDFGGLFRVGVHLEGGGFTAVHVDPTSLELRSTVVFIRNDHADVPAVPPDDVLV